MRFSHHQSPLLQGQAQFGLSQWSFPIPWSLGWADGLSMAGEHDIQHSCLTIVAKAVILPLLESREHVRSGAVAATSTPGESLSEKETTRGGEQSWSETMRTTISGNHGSLCFKLSLNILLTLEFPASEAKHLPFSSWRVQFYVTGKTD